MDMNRLRTNWIWLPTWTPEDDSDARIVFAFLRAAESITDIFSCS